MLLPLRVVDAMSPPEDVPDNCPMHPAEAYQSLVEQIVETDEGLMNRYLEGETLPLPELRAAACRAIHICGSHSKDSRVVAQSGSDPLAALFGYQKGELVVSLDISQAVRESNQNGLDTA